MCRIATTARVGLRAVCLVLAIVDDFDDDGFDGFDVVDDRKRLLPMVVDELWLVGGWMV